MSDTPDTPRAPGAPGATVELALEVPAERMPLGADDFAALVERALALAGFEGALSLAVVDDVRMRELNRDFHDCDAATDVLAFPLDPLPGAGGFSAEVVVSLDTALREAAERGVEPVAELLLYVVHGVLHLLGEDDHDPEDAARMHARTLRILGALGYRNDIRAG